MNYGELPIVIDKINLIVNEMMFYQYLPIKLVGQKEFIFEDRLKCFEKVIEKSCMDFIEKYGIQKYLDSYIYVTAKNLYQTKTNFFNRTGWHSDGFMTNDVNYIWYDKDPTIFNNSSFNLSMDDSKSLIEMEIQAIEQNNISYNCNSLLRLNQYNIHKVNDNIDDGVRTFLKVSFSEDKYDLEGNSHNYLLNYDWSMRKREINRNIPQKLK